jgi:hypothetical protein
LPATWHVASSTPYATQAQLSLIGTTQTSFAPALWSEVKPMAGSDARAALQSAAMEVAERFVDFNPMRLDAWDRFYPGSLVLDFRVAITPGDTGTSAIGSMVLAPLPNGEAFVATVLHDIADLNRRWDLARALAQLPRPPRQ